MNTIKTRPQKSLYEPYEDYQFYIDGIPFDSLLAEKLNNPGIRGLISTLGFEALWGEGKPALETEAIWDNIFPKKGVTTYCALTACPDCRDLDCGSYSAEIVHTSVNTIVWNRLGIDQSKTWAGEKRYGNINWMEEWAPLEFVLEQYTDCLTTFWGGYTQEYNGLKGKIDSKTYFKLPSLEELFEI